MRKPMPYLKVHLKSGGCITIVGWIPDATVSEQAKEFTRWMRTPGHVVILTSPVTGEEHVVLVEQVAVFTMGGN